MPNWVCNSLRIINGNPQEIFEFIRSDKSVFDFNTLVQMPENIKNSDKEVPSDNFSIPAWYEWSLQNWGTKWNACDAKYSTTDPQHELWFDTAWSPPVAVFEALAKQFPTHEIVIQSDEFLNHLHVVFTLKGGQVAWADDACHCFDEDESSLSAGEMSAFGIEDVL